jgi:hypothetical protein
MEVRAQAPGSHPDITGSWGALWKRDNVDPKLVVQDGPPPQFNPEYTAKYREIRKLRDAVQSAKGAGAAAANSEFVLRETSCLPYGMPYMMNGGYSIEILQAHDHLTIVSEAMLEVRRIYLDKTQPPLDEVDIGYEGHSVGKWDGNTLVVNTVGIKPSVLGYHDMPHSDQLTLTERIRLLTPELLQNTITVTDPKALVHPYTFTYTLKRLVDYETPEYVCDNRREKIDSDGKIHVDLKGSQ